jgi:hypothetical protein
MIAMLPFTHRDFMQLFNQYKSDKVLHSIDFQLSRINVLATPRLNLYTMEMDLVLTKEMEQMKQSLEEQRQMHVDRYYKALFEKKDNSGN